MEQEKKIGPGSNTEKMEERKRHRAGQRKQILMGSMTEEEREEKGTASWTDGYSKK